MIVRFRVPYLVGALALVLVAVLAPARALSATACYNVSCASACSPTPPAAVSALITGFPVGGSTPIDFADPDDGLTHRFVATKQGLILVWDGTTQALLATPFLDLRDDSGGPVYDTGSEQGLLAMAFEPDYAESGRFYVYYTRKNTGTGTQGDIVIARYQRSAGSPNIAEPASAATILVIEHSGAANHNGGDLQFGPDGFLYISTGDGGNSCDDGQGTSGDGQRTNSLLGKILRIDVRGVDPGAGAPDDCGVEAGPYTVPVSNPFAGQEPACDEVWAYGLRNPFRFSFDRETGDLYLGDVGQAKWEEINLKRASTAAPVNFGWVCREGCETAGNDESGCATGGCPVDPGTTCEFPRSSGFWDPILCHHNTGWVSIMGGYRYRGTRVPSLEGQYMYGDAGCGQIWVTTALDPANPGAIAAACWENAFSGTYGFGEDHLGELYVVQGGGTISCVHNGDGCYWARFRGLFEDDFESSGLTHWSATAGGI
jgi:glucose/arabinose dehydrogenase